MAYFEIAEKTLINLPIGSVIKVGSGVGWRNFYFQHQVSGVVAISPGAYCRALGL